MLLSNREQPSFKKNLIKKNFGGKKEQEGAQLFVNILCVCVFNFRRSWTPSCATGHNTGLVDGSKTPPRLILATGAMWAYQGDKAS